MSIACHPYGILMDDIQTLGQGYLSLAQAIQCRNILGTPY